MRPAGVAADRRLQKCKQICLFPRGRLTRRRRGQRPRARRSRPASDEAPWHALLKACLPAVKGLIQAPGARESFPRGLGSTTIVPPGGPSALPASVKYDRHPFHSRRHQHRAASWITSLPGRAPSRTPAPPHRRSPPDGHHRRVKTDRCRGWISGYRTVPPGSIAGCCTFCKMACSALHGTRADNPYTPINPRPILRA